MKRLLKEQSRKRWKEVRALWNEWDPIGVVTEGGVEDEYDGYLGPTLRLLEKGASEEAIGDYLSGIVGDYMGLGESGIKHSRPLEFAKRLKEWYKASWPDTMV